MNKAEKRRIADKMSSAGLLCLTGYLGWKLRCPSPPLILSFILCFLFTAGVYFFYRASVNKAVYEQDKDGIRFRVTGPVALFCFVLPIFLTFGYTKLAKNVCELANLQVIVHSATGKQDRVLKNRGKVLLFGLPRVDSAAIDHIGEAHFEYLAAGHTIMLGLMDAGQWVPLYPDSIYTIENNVKLELIVGLSHVDTIRGSISDENRVPIIDVKVRMSSVQTFSGDDGCYTLVIPRELWNEKYTFYFSKQGFEPTSDYVYPPTANDEAYTIMKRLKARSHQ